MLDILIATKKFPVADRSFLPGDRFDPKRPPASVHLDERQVGALQRGAFIAPLTRDTYQVAMARRTSDMPKIGRGFTETELVELGVIDQPKAKPAAKEVVTTSPGKPAPQPGVPAGDPIEIRPGFFLHPMKRGNLPPTYDLKNAEGELLRPERFGKVDKALAYLDGLLAKAAQIKAAQQQEPNNGGIVQPGADEPGEPSPAEDR